MKEILLRKSDSLSGACRNYFEQLKTHLKETNKTAFTNYEIRMALRENHSNQKRYMIQLLQGHYVKRIEQDSKNKTHSYEIVSPEEYKQLQNNISNALDNILKELKTVQQFKQVQKENELINTSKINTLQTSSQSLVQKPMRQKNQITPAIQNAFNILLNHSKENPNTQYTTKLVMQLSGKSQKSVQIYLNELTQLQALQKTMQGATPYYTIITNNPLNTTPTF